MTSCTPGISAGWADGARPGTAPGLRHRRPGREARRSEAYGEPVHASSAAAGKQRQSPGGLAAAACSASGGPERVRQRPDWLRADMNGIEAGDAPVTGPVSVLFVDETGWHATRDSIRPLRVSATISTCRQSTLDLEGIGSAPSAGNAGQHVADGRQRKQDVARRNRRGVAAPEGQRQRSRNPPLRRIPRLGVLDQPGRPFDLNGRLGVEGLRQLVSR